MKASEKTDGVECRRQQNFSEHEEITASQYIVDRFYRSDRVRDDHTDPAIVRPAFPSDRMANWNSACFLLFHAVSGLAGPGMVFRPLRT